MRPGRASGRPDRQVPDSEHDAHDGEVVGDDDGEVVNDDNDDLFKRMKMKITCRMLSSSRRLR